MKSRPRYHSQMKQHAWRAGVALLALACAARTAPALAAGAPDKPSSQSAATQKQLPPPDPNPANTMMMIAKELERSPEHVVLRVGGVPVTQGEMADVVRSLPVSMAGLGLEGVSQHALDIVVSQKAMALNAIGAGLDKDPAVQRLIAASRDRALADAWLRRNSNQNPSVEALKARYDRDVAGKPGPAEVQARVIVVPTEDEARLILDKLRAGGDFPDLARTYSKDPTAAQGGALGFATLDALTPEVGYVAFALSPGQVSPFPVRMKSGSYIIVRVDGRRQRGTPTFEEARPGLEQVLRAEALQETVRNAQTQVKLSPEVQKAVEPGKQ